MVANQWRGLIQHVDTVGAKLSTQAMVFSKKSAGETQSPYLYHNYLFTRLSLFFFSFEMAQVIRGKGKGVTRV